jgi:hypothetical protein
MEEKLNGVKSHFETKCSFDKKDEGVISVKKDWKITFEILPMRGLYEEVISANTQEGAIEFLETLKRHKIRVVKVELVSLFN